MTEPTETATAIETPAPRKPAQREDVAVMLVGLWLMFCPPTLELNAVPLDTYTTVLTGVVLIVLGGTGMRVAKEGVEWAVVAAGAFLVVAPWALGFTLKAATVNAVACGIGVAALAGWRIYDIRAKRAAAAGEKVAVPAAEEPRRAA